jgi:uncharacterized protein (DUF952 family)
MPILPSSAKMSPSYVFKIVTDKPNLNSENVQLADLDLHSGFIHLSTGQQISRVCNMFFSEVEILYVLKFAYDKLAANMKWELAPGGEELFPHLHAALFTKDVDSTREFHRKEGENWLDVLSKESWLS